MPPPARPHVPSGHAAWEWVMTDDGSRTLWDVNLDETFHSGCGAVAETLVVYLYHSGVLARLRQQEATRVLEYGLGTATGFLLTAALAEYYRTPLVFTSLEYSLLPVDLFEQLQLEVAINNCLAHGFAKTSKADPLYSRDEFSALHRLTDAFRLAVADWHKRHATGAVNVKISEFVELQLWLDDASRWTPQQRECVRWGEMGYDAIYFDPFSPESNPEMWQATTLGVAASALRPGGLLTSYCVKSSVRSALRACGLEVHKVAGPVGGKREVLVAQRATSSV